MAADDELMQRLNNPAFGNNLKVAQEGGNLVNQLDKI